MSIRTLNLEELSKQWVLSCLTCPDYTPLNNLIRRNIETKKIEDFAYAQPAPAFVIC